MPADFVALDVVQPGPERYEIAAVAQVGEQRAEVTWLIGCDPVAARARAHAEAGAEVLEAAGLAEVLADLLARAGDACWVTFDLDEWLDAWAEADGTGAVAEVEQHDAGDLVCLATAAPARDLPGLLAAAGLAAEQPPRGLPTARAVAALWAAAPGLIAARPYAVRAAVAELLEQCRHPFAALWRAQVGSARAGEAGHIEPYLRERTRRLTPNAVEPPAPPKTRPIDVDEVASWFAPDGPIAGQMERYERRDGQVEMARAVASALNEGACLLVEAGTGTGKSVAYLAPALKFAVANKVPVVVSTNTKNLQDQLRGKDLPLLQRALDFEFRAVPVKGRANYLCVEKLLSDLGMAGLLPFDDELFHLACLVSWAAATEDGDLDELSPYLAWRYPRLASYARRFGSDSETCTATSARNHPCFATVARRRAAEADLLVVNHALSMANATVEVLPPFRHVIFDEAHNLEDIATEAFGLALDRRGLLRLVRELGPSRDARSLINRCRAFLAQAPDETAAAVLVELTSAEQAASQVAEATDTVGELLGGLVMQRLGRSSDELTRTEKLRLDPTVWDGALGQSLRAAAENLQDRIGEVIAALSRVGVGLLQIGGPEGAGDTSDELQALRVAAQARLENWTEQATVLGQLMELDDERFVYWLEFVLRRDAWEWRLRAAPIEAGEELAAHIYRTMEAVVLTSATLTVNHRFDYFAARLGLTAEGVADRYRCLAVPSGFDYRRQVLLGLPVNIALPQDEQFQRHVARAVEDLAGLLEGRTLVLFTALRAMQRAYEELAPKLRQAGIEPLCQGISGTRHALAERFRRDERSVLFGTRSFWEGIDVPGDALRCVVIVKLPFTVPDDPVHEARCQHLEAQGQNAWTSYSVPQAVILFKQGFGRLIRTADDRGAVIVLDRRLRERNYGRAFLESVPGYSGVFDTWSEVKERLRGWFGASAEPRRRTAPAATRDGEVA